MGGAEVPEEQGAQAPGKRRARHEPREDVRRRRARCLGNRALRLRSATEVLASHRRWWDAPLPGSVRSPCCRVEPRAVESATLCFCGGVAGRWAPARVRAATAPAEGGAR